MEGCPLPCSGDSGCLRGGGGGGDDTLGDSGARPTCLPHCAPLTGSHCQLSKATEKGTKLPLLEEEGRGHRGTRGSRGHRGRRESVTPSTQVAGTTPLSLWRGGPAFICMLKICPVCSEAETRIVKVLTLDLWYSIFLKRLETNLAIQNNIFNASFC